MKREAALSVYRVTDLVGASKNGWEDAARQALSAASLSLRDLRVAEVVSKDVTLSDKGRIDAYRIKLRVSFKYEEE